MVIQKEDLGGCKSLFVHARWRPLRRGETKRRNRNGEQEEKGRHQEVVTQEESRTIIEEKSGKENLKKACGCQEVKAGGKEKIRQKRGKKIH